MFCSMSLDANNKNETVLTGLNPVGIKFHVFYRVHVIKSCEKFCL